MPVLGTGTCSLLDESKGRFSSCFENEEGTGAPGTKESRKDHSRQSAWREWDTKCRQNPWGLAGWPCGGFGPTFTPVPATGDGDNKAPSALSPCAYLWQRMYKAYGLWGRNEEAWQTIHDAPMCAVVRRCSAEGCCWVGGAWACHLGAVRRPAQSAAPTAAGEVTASLPAQEAS